MSLRSTFFVLLALGLAAPASAQSIARQRALAYLQSNAARHSLSAADVAELVVTDETVSATSGVTHVYVRQAIGGVPVEAGAMTVNVARDGRVLLASGELVQGLSVRARRSSAALSPEQAVEALAADAGLQPAEAFRTTAPAFAAGDRAVLTTGGGLTRVPVYAGLVYAADASGALRLAYETTLYLRSGGADWYGLVDAATGAILERTDILARDSFGPASLVPTADAPAPALRPMLPAATPLADLTAAIGGASYRVFAMPNESPIHNTVLPPADGRVLVSNVESATASPFGWHDTNGVAGAEFTRAQGNNVHAYADRNDSDDAQATEEVDGGATLTFDFPIDLGQAPATYQNAAVTNLFYWNNVFHDLLAGFGFDAASGNFQQNLYGATTGIGNDAVQAEAQDGAVTCNDPNNPTCTNNANFSTPADGQPGRMQMYEWTTRTPRLDGDLDAGIIVHEYTHGVSTRLTGGPSNTGCLRNSEQAGEGWSDWYGLMMTMKPGDTRTLGRGIGTYALNQPTTGLGIRPARYSTDFAVNNYTYQRTRSGLAVPHGIGFAWTTILWEVTWDMIDAYGFSPDLSDASGTAGNQMMLNLVTEGLKLQPCSPGFVDARDAILAADVALYNGVHVPTLWAGFARRGLGSGASQGSSASNTDNTESFIEPEAIAPAAITDLAAIPNGDYVTLTFTATGDDGAVGTARTYTVRRSATPIVTEADFAAATNVPITDTPAIAGTPQAIRATGLAFTTAYYFAMKATDESGNASPMSNAVQATTLAAPVATVPANPISVATSTTTTATADARQRRPVGPPLRALARRGRAAARRDADHARSALHTRAAEGRARHARDGDGQPLRRAGRLRLPLGGLQRARRPRLQLDRHLDDRHGRLARRRRCGDRPAAVSLPVLRRRPDVRSHRVQRLAWLRRRVHGVRERGHPGRGRPEQRALRLLGRPQPERRRPGEVPGHGRRPLRRLVDRRAALQRGGLCADLPGHPAARWRRHVPVQDDDGHAQLGLDRDREPGRHRRPAGGLQRGVCPEQPRDPLREPLRRGGRDGRAHPGRPEPERGPDV